MRIQPQLLVYLETVIILLTVFQIEKELFLLELLKLEAIHNVVSLKLPAIS